MLGISSQQRLQLDEIQKDIDGRLDRLLSAGQKKDSAKSTPGGFGFSNPGQVMSSSEQNRLKLTDDQRKDIAALQKAVDARFDKVLSEAQKKQIKSVLGTFTRAVATPPNAGVPRLSTVLTAAQQDALKLSPDQKKRMAEIEREVDAKLQTLLTEAQQTQLQTLRQTPPGNLAGGPGPGPQGGTPLFRAYRYAIDYPAFVGRNLTPGRALEEPEPKEKVAE
jgi:hypothetical protein